MKEYDGWKRLLWLKISRSNSTARLLRNTNARPTLFGSRSEESEEQWNRIGGGKSEATKMEWSRQQHSFICTRKQYLLFSIFSFYFHITSTRRRRPLLLLVLIRLQSLLFRLLNTAEYGLCTSCVAISVICHAAKHWVVWCVLRMAQGSRFLTTVNAVNENQKQRMNI